MKKYGRLLLGLVISIGFLVWAIKELNLSEFWQELQQANYWWLIPGVAAYFVGVWARTWRWHYMLRPLKSIPLSRLFPVVCIGYAGNNIYPARAGEVLRAYILKKQEGIPVSANMATVVVERIFDGMVMLSFVVLTLPFTDFGEAYNSYVILFSLLFTGGLAIFLMMAMRPRWIGALLDFLLPPLVPARFHGRIHELAARFIEGLVSLRSGRDVLMIFVTSVVVWLLETLKYWFVMHAFPFSVPFAVLMLMNGIVNLMTTLPGPPGHLGTFDIPGIAVLQSFGVEKTMAWGYTTVLHVALWFPITILGLVYLAHSQVNVKRVQHEMVME